MQKIYLLLFYKYWLKYKLFVRLLRVETENNKNLTPSSSHLTTSGHILGRHTLRNVLFQDKTKQYETTIRFGGISA